MKLFSHTRIIRNYSETCLCAILYQHKAVCEELGMLYPRGGGNALLSSTAMSGKKTKTCSPPCSSRLSTDMSAGAVSDTGGETANSEDASDDR